MKYLSYTLGIILFLAIVLTIQKFPFISDMYSSGQGALVSISLPAPFQVTHIDTPESVKAIYMSSWVAGNKKLRDNLIKLIDETELNAVVIDIKDYTGRVAFKNEGKLINEYGSIENRIPDIKEFIGTLHDKNIYVIGRISVFQDSYLVHKKPEFAVRNKSGNVWKDRKGVSWLDVGAKPVWEYIAEIGDESYAVGFDELNFDYIRFPSDGDMTDIVYPYSEGKVKSIALKEFFNFIESRYKDKNIPTSADLFGMTTSNTDDLGIGQILEYALEHFDYVAPMVYPSHYPKDFMGFESPASKPYEVIKYTMNMAVKRAINASTTPNKLRPWLQDFSIGRVDYTPEMVRAQINATYDTGLNSWLLWNASNVYSKEALKISTSTKQN